MRLTPPDPATVTADVERALAEDVGSGDLTASLLPDAPWRARVIAREPAIISGRPWFDEVYRQLDDGIRIDWAGPEGEAVSAQTPLCELTGPARCLVTGERTALNFLQTLSGTATQARRYADAVAGTATRILDTRKTLPGLRAAQKYAVRCGGCHNHRQGLFDAVLIKENHILACGSITRAVAIAREAHPNAGVEVEVETWGELDEAVAARADRIMLDNFAPAALRRAVDHVAGRVPLEVSGNVELDRISELAATGVDCISTGALTKHVRAIDLSMRFF
jgi:nicotinate-nucleotide pyrophosphorylase (carboxylating)